MDRANLIVVETRCRSCASEDLVTIQSWPNWPLVDAFYWPTDSPPLGFPLTLCLCRQCALVQDQLDAIHNSTSWRITKPLRTLGHARKRRSGR